MTVTLYHGDCLEVLKTLDAGSVDVVVTDPPYGMDYHSSANGRFGDCAIDGDKTTALRDAVIQWAISLDIPCLVFGSWKATKPAQTRALLVWEKGDHVGMGDLSIPWKPNTEEVYVIGSGFTGHRGSSVLRVNALSPNFFHTHEPRQHPTQKPIELLRQLIEKCPQGAVLDPFMGSGTTGVACVQTGRNFIGIEIDRTYFEIAERRIAEAQAQMRMEL